VTVLNEADAIMLGNQAVSAVYAGADKVWPAAPPPLGPYAEAVIASNPDSWLRLGETGPVAADQVAGGANGAYGTGITQAQPSLLPSGEGASATFAAGNTGVTVPDALGNRLSTVTGYTIEMWLKPTAVTQNILMPETFGLAMAWQMNILFVFIANAQNQRGLTDPFDPAKGNHLAVTIGARSGTAVPTGVYLNGATQFTNNQWIGSADVTGSTGIRLGGPGQSYAAAYVGSMQEVCLYHRPLPAQEIFDHYAAAQP